MKEYDIIVVGAGPAGSSAAKAAAEKGAKVIILEEHPQIGIPRHCTGVLFPSAYQREILGMVGEDLIIQEVKGERRYSPGGNLLGETHVPEYLIRREEFDRQWAKFAATAGAKIVVNTRVTGLLKKKGRIIGVTTSSHAIPEVRGKLVIAAGGYKAERTGIPAQEGLSRPDEEFYNGVLLEVTNVKDIEPGVIERYHGVRLFRRGYGGMFPLNENTIVASFASMEEFEQVKAADLIMSHKLRDAQVIQIRGYIVPLDWSLTLPKTIKDGLILVGSAAGFNGMIPAVITGRYAGEVAADAIEAGDVTEAKLKKYEDTYKAEGWDRMYQSAIIYKRKLRELIASQISDEEIESTLIEMNKQGAGAVYRP